METWLGQFGLNFVNPAIVAGGVALAASPIIIHLINRVRYRRVRFAAMEFLLKSQQRNRRRLLLEQLLLLLMRVAIVMLLVALIGRLILDQTQLSIFRGAVTHHVVLLDDSGSMQNRRGETTAFEEAQKVVRKIAAEGARRPGTQTLSVILLSDPDNEWIPSTDVNEAFAVRLEDHLESLRCTHRALDILVGLEAARKRLTEEVATIKQLHVVSDFRQRDWSSGSATASALGGLVDANVAVNLVKTAAGHDENLAITQLGGSLKVAAAGVPLRLTVGVRNFGNLVAKDVRLSIYKDGQKLPLGIKFEEVEAGREVTREFDVTLKTAARHRLEITLEGDALAADNSRFLAVEVSQTNPVLIIDGDPEADEASYVADALSAAPGLTGIVPRIEAVDYLRRNSIDAFACVYMVNIAELPPDALEPLADYVAAGGGLVWFMGDAVKPAYYNAQLYRDGTEDGLFPVPLARARRELVHDDEFDSGADLVTTGHELLRIFDGQENPFLESLRVGDFLPAADGWERDDNSRRDGVDTIATLRNNQPLLLEHRFGMGRVVTCLTSAGPNWNNWARNPSYVVFQLELQRYVARNDRVPLKRTVGEPIDISLDPALYSPDVEVSAPDQTGARITRLTAAQQHADSAETPVGPHPDGSVAADVRPFLAEFRDTDWPGIYSIKLLDKDQIPEEHWYAYNAPIEESELKLAKNNEILGAIDGQGQIQIHEAGSFGWIEGKDAGQDIRDALLVLLVAALVIEQILAFRMSYHPQRAGAVA